MKYIILTGCLLASLFAIPKSQAAESKAHCAKYISSILVKSNKTYNKKSTVERISAAINRGEFQPIRKENLGIPFWRIPIEFPTSKGQVTEYKLKRMVDLLINKNRRHNTGSEYLDSREDLPVSFLKRKIQGIKNAPRNAFNRIKKKSYNVIDAFKWTSLDDAGFEYFKEKFTQEIAYKNALEIFSEMGLIKESRYSSIRLKWNKQKLLRSWIFRSLMTGSFLNDGTLLIMLPKGPSNFLKISDLSDELIERAFNEGLNSIRADIPSTLLDSANRDVLLARISQSLFISTLVVLTVQSVYEYQDEIGQIFKLSSIFLSELWSGMTYEIKQKTQLDRLLLKCIWNFTKKNDRMPNKKEIEAMKIVLMLFG